MIIFRELACKPCMTEEGCSYFVELGVRNRLNAVCYSSLVRDERVAERSGGSDTHLRLVGVGCETV